MRTPEDLSRRESNNHWISEHKNCLKQSGDLYKQSSKSRVLAVAISGKTWLGLSVLCRTLSILETGADPMLTELGQSRSEVWPKFGRV